MSANRPCGRLATSGWQLLFATREKTKARGSPTGRRPYSALVFHGKNHVFEGKTVVLFMLWFQPGGGYAALFPALTKGKASPLGAKSFKKSPQGLGLTVVAPEV